MVDDYKVVFGGRRFDCVDNGFGKNEVVDVVIRPEDLDIVPRGEGKLKGVVKSVLFKRGALRKPWWKQRSVRKSP